MPDRRTYLELLHTEIDASAKSFAQTLFEGVSQGITEGIQQDLDQFESVGAIDQVPDGDADALVIPAFTAQVFEHLGQMSLTAASGWLDVFFTNLRERYENGKGIET